jgi:hypothetical protein
MNIPNAACRNHAVLSPVSFCFFIMILSDFSTRCRRGIPRVIGPPLRPTPLIKDTLLQVTKFFIQ